MCELARRRYAARAVTSSNGIPVPRMSQLLTYPLLVALPTSVGNRRISAGSTVDAASAPHRTMTTAWHCLTPAQSYQRQSSAAKDSNKSASEARTTNNDPFSAATTASRLQRGDADSRLSRIDREIGRDSSVLP